MAYDYQTEKPRLFTEDGVDLLIKLRERTLDLLHTAGAARMDAIIRGASGDTWAMLACVDRMVETGLLRELTGPDVAGQHRVFVRARESF